MGQSDSKSVDKGINDSNVPDFGIQSAGLLAQNAKKVA